MSSLRLALKQSLEEACGGPPQPQKKSGRPRGRPPGSGRPVGRPPKRRPGEPPRKRGRPRKNPLPEEQPSDHDGESSSENEFSVNDEEEGNIQKREMKHSAANTIQSHWKKKKKPMKEGGKEDEPPKKPENKQDTDDEVPKPKEAKKSSGKAKTVPPPSVELIEWARGLSTKKQKRNIAAGMRVKVRFATNVRKANGNIARKLKWYGGLVTGVSKGGSKIRIKYDDGTSEVSKFPDKDIIVDDEGNGTHRVSPGKFVPLKDRGEKKIKIERMDEPNDEKMGLEKSVKKHTSASEDEQAVASVEVRKRDDDGHLEDEQMDISEEAASLVVASTNQTDEAKIPPKPSLKIRLKTPKAIQEFDQVLKLVKIQSSEEQEEHADYRLDDEDVMSDEQERNKETVVQEDDGEPDDASKSPREMTNSEDAMETLGNYLARRKRAYDHASADESIDEPPKKKHVVESDSTTFLKHEHDDVERDISGTAESKTVPEPEFASHESAGFDEAEEEGSSFPPTERKRRRDESASSNNSRSSSKSPPPETDTLIPMSAYLKESTSTADDDLSKPVSSVSSTKKVASDQEEELASEELTSSKNSILDRKDEVAAADLSEGSQQTDAAKTESKEEVDARTLAMTPPPPQEGESSADFLSPAVSVPRFGRRAAQEANQRIAARQEIVIQDPYAKTKKRKEKSDLKLFSSAERKGKPPANDSDDEDEREWVQCDNCLKWRILPSDVQTSKLPKHWYCEMNVYDQFRNTCDAPEQTAQEIAKEKRRRKRKLAKIARLEAAGELDPETAAAQRNALTKEKRPKKERSPIPAFKASQEKEAERDPDNATEPGTKRTSPFSSEESAHVADSPQSDTGSDPHKHRSIKKQASFNSTSRKSRSDDTEDVNMEVDVDGESVPTVKVSRGRGRPRVNKDGDRAKNDKGKNGDKEEDPDNLEWVMCEKCSKWRRLPPHISADSLPDVWYCTMNTWDQRSATCEAEEDKADPTHREFGIYGSGVSTASYGNKLSYRNLIFGTGRKQNRPVSERTRAAESLFLTPTDPSSEGVSYPKVMYANSSVFMPRNINASKSNVSDNCEKPSLFDLMSRSNLWAELRGARIGKPGKIGSSYANSSFDALSSEMKRTMKQLIVHALGSGTLACHEVLLEAQCRQWTNVPQEWAEIRALCTVDIVEGALHELIMDGLVESVSNAAHAEVSSPKYRSLTRTAMPAVNKEIKVTRCMKITKPWKKARPNISHEFCQ